MELFYREEHLSCPYYDKEARPVFEIHELEAGATFSEHARLCKIIFVLEGEMQYSEGLTDCGRVSRGQLFLLPPDRNFIVTAITGLKVLIVRLKQIIRFCECFATDELIRTASGDIEELIRPQTPSQMPIERALKIFADSMELSLQQGFRCSNYFKTKVWELFYLFRAFYTKQQLAGFFSQMLRGDAGFYYRVKQNYRNYRTVAELAAALNMSPGNFERHFKKVFGMPAYHWMVEKKAAHIHQALRMEDTPIKELALRFGFTSKSTFSAFCRKNLGQPPGMIRKIGIEKEDSAN